MLIALAEPVRAWRPEAERHAASVLGALESRGATIIGLSACLGVGFGPRSASGVAERPRRCRARQHSSRFRRRQPRRRPRRRRAGDHAAVRLLRVSAVLLAVGLALPLLGWSLPSMAVLAFLAGLAIAPVVMSAYGLVDAVAARGPPPRRSPGSRPPSSRLLGGDGALGR